jgi:putative ABC transport system permease protein
VISAGVIPTATGDPLLLNLSDGLSNNEVILTTSLARKLSVSKADRILAQNSRRMGGVEEIFELRLTVKAILPSHLVDGDRAFLNAGNLEMLEAFLDGYAVGDNRTGQDMRLRPKRYESVRLYTTDLESVASVDEIISALGYTIASRGAEVRSILALDRSLLLVFGGLALIASTGYVVSLAASLTATFEHNRRHVGLLRLCGANRLEIAMWPLVQGLAITLIGFTVALGVYLAFAIGLNILFSDTFLEGRPICQLNAHHVLVALLCTVCLVLLISLRFSYKLAKISPAEALRIE